MAQHRERFEAFCRSLSAGELATQVPDTPWTVHGYIAHLCTIDSLISPFFGPMVGITDVPPPDTAVPVPFDIEDRKSTRLNSSHITISYAVFCLKKKKK